MQVVRLCLYWLIVPVYWLAAALLCEFLFWLAGVS